MTVQQPSAASRADRPEMRQDVTTGDWVIMAPVRAQRPHQFAAPKRRQLPPVDAACPFCPGQEAQTPPPVVVLPAASAPQCWVLRVIPNKFPALEPDGTTWHGQSTAFFPAQVGFGYHEVIIESPDHHGHLPTLPPAQVALLVSAWRDRFRVLQQHPQVRSISLFKNHGAQAGASLAHPHTQILAIPVVSAAIQTRYTLAQQYHTAQQRCLYCDLLSAELADPRRVVCANDSYVAYQPYAARFPFETWLVPRQHQACFGAASDTALATLVPVLQDLMRRLDLLLQVPDYNLLVHSALRQESRESYHWFFQIIPRLVGIAGFELGTGMALNATLPETAATLLRCVPLPAL